MGGVHGGECPRQKPIPRQREHDARHRQRHAAQVAEHRDRRAGEQQRPRPAAEGRARRVGQRRRRPPSAVAEDALRRDLERDVERRDAEHRQRDGAGHGARGVPHLAARHERRLDAGEGEHEEQRRAGDVGGRRPDRHGEVLASHQEQPADGDEQQRQQLGHRRHRVQPRAEGDAAHVHQRPEPERHQQHVRLPRRERRDQLPDAGGEHRCHGGGREQAEHPQHDAREERGVRPQRGADVRVGTAGERHAAARVRDAQHDQPHRHRADDVGDRRSGTEGAGDAGRQAEDAAADGDVDDGGGEAERADGPEQRLRHRRGVDDSGVGVAGTRDMRRQLSARC